MGSPSRPVGTGPIPDPRRIPDLPPAPPGVVPAPAHVPHLPIHVYEAEIVAVVSNHPVVVVIGETGSGKTTQIAQFLHRAGLTAGGAVAVTQPRRVAAVTVARRVAQEMGVAVGSEVGYAVRFEDCSSPKTNIKYLTDGCLLRECLTHPQLAHYSVIVLDEAHERTVNTDILFGLLRRLVAIRRPPLKLVITSATLDSEKFAKFFGGCPVLRVPGRLHPVQILHSTERPASYLESAVQTVVDIHLHRGPGDVLVFLTGQEEIMRCCRQLSDAISSLDEGSCGDIVILPLYASLPPEMQACVFTPPPPHTRRVVVATNIAETSVTVDGVAYVVDPGVVKQRQYSPQTGMESLTVVPISRVQAVQRAGRAGRTRPGFCFRLYTKATFDHDMDAVTIPEIQRCSLAGAVLHLKSLELPDVDVLSFPLLDPPPRAALVDALHQLYALEAIDEDGEITALGKRMSALPLDPPLARALIAAAELDALDDALTVAAMLSCEGVLVGQGEDGAPGSNRPALPDGGGLGDHVMFLQIFEEWVEAGKGLEWCKQRGVKARSLQFADNVRRQLAVCMGSGESQGWGGGEKESTGEGRGNWRTVPLEGRGGTAGGREGGGGGEEGRRTGMPSLGDGERKESENIDLEVRRKERKGEGKGHEGTVARGGKEHWRDGRRARDGMVGREGREDRKGREGREEREERSGRKGKGGGESWREEMDARVGLSRDSEDWAERRTERRAERRADTEGRESKRKKALRDKWEKEGVGGRGLRDQEPGPSQRGRIESTLEDRTRALRHALAIGFCGKLARRMERHNGYRTVGDCPKLAQVHPSNAPLRVDDDGLLPYCLLFHELIATTRPFLRYCCVVEEAWIELLLPRLTNVDIGRLSGGHLGLSAPPPAPPPDEAPAEDGSKVGTDGPAEQQEPAASSVDAARLRYLQRKLSRGGGTSG